MSVSRFLLLYEDSHWEDLSPLADLLPVPGLRFGASSLAERWLAALKLPLLAVEARAGALAAWHEAPAVAGRRPDAGDEVLAVNAAATPGAWAAELAREGPPALYVSGGEPVGARLAVSSLQGCLGTGPRFDERLRALDLARVEVEAEVLRWPWDFVRGNLAALEADLGARAGVVAGEVAPGAALLERARITVEPGARVDPFAVLDARQGPIWIGRDALILAHSVVEGPCFIGAGTQVLGGVVRRSTVGPDCRVAGEIEESIWQGLANKRHHGFVGHSIVGEWVNLGALTTTSDLKNNYGLVRAWAGGRERDSGTSKVGSFIGAHVKTGIGSLLPTGGSVGVGTNLFGAGRFAPKRLPPFSWWDGERAVEHRLDAFLRTASVVMGRRGRALEAAERALLEAHFRASAVERGEWLRTEAAAAARDLHA